MGVYICGCHARPHLPTHTDRPIQTTNRWRSTASSSSWPATSRRACARSRSACCTSPSAPRCSSGERPIGVAIVLGGVRYSARTRPTKPPTKINHVSLTCRLSGPEREFVKEYLDLVVCCSYSIHYTHVFDARMWFAFVMSTFLPHLSHQHQSPNRTGTRRTWCWRTSPRASRA